ncbi:DUF305 domain-containing protein [Streptomyces capparidis]
MWWPAAVGAVLALCLALGAALVYSGDDGSGTPGTDSVEAGFARDMIVHHQQAVEMSFIVRERTDDEEVRRLAFDIINTQANQRGMMLGWLDMWGLTPTSGRTPMAWMGGAHADFEPRDGATMPGMATRTQLAELDRAEGRAAEVEFLRLMTAHHRGGVEMAQAAERMSDNEQVDRLAGGIVDSQESEIKLMNDMLAERGAEPA